MSDVTDAQREIAGIVAQRKETRMTQKRSADITIPAPMARPDCSAESDPATLTFEAEDLGAAIARLLRLAKHDSPVVREGAVCGLGSVLQALRDLSADPSPGVRAAADEALADDPAVPGTPEVEWRDGQASAGPLNLSVWEYGGGLGGFGWAVSLSGDDIAACHWRHPLPTLDAAKAAAIAAARAWRDSIRL